MLSACTAYLTDLSEQFGNGWNRFWYTRSDPFTLSVIRVLAGGLATYMVLSYTPDLERFFGPDGILSVETVRTLAVPGMDRAMGIENSYRFSFLDYCQSATTLRAAHWTSVAILAAFTLGIFSRISSILALVVFISYAQRATCLTAQAEPILSFILLYLCIGPSGACLSIDRWLASRKAGALAKLPDTDRTSISATIAIRLIQLHLTVVFLMMALAKNYGVLWWNGTAIAWLIVNSPGRIINLQGITENTYLINIWTHAQVAYEMTFPIFIWNRLARPLWLVAGLVLWSLMAALTGLVAFAFAVVIATLAFVEPTQMRAIFDGLTRRAEVSKTA
jgi:hypothetical protein